MASDTILNNLFEIAQSEVDEILYFNDFSKELRDNFKELTNDEYDSALIAINEQVKSGNKLMEFSTGKISISNSIISKAINTVEYERQQRESYQNTLEDGKISIENVIITTAVLNEMINNYENLSQDEKNKVIDNLDKLDFEQMGDVLGKIADDFRQYSESANTPEKQAEFKFAEDVTESFKKLYDEYKAGDFESVRDFFIKHQSIVEAENKRRKKEGKEEIDIYSITDISDPRVQDLMNAAKSKTVEVEKVFNEFLQLSLKDTDRTTDENERFEELQEIVNTYKDEFPEEYEAFKEALKKGAEKSTENGRGSNTQEHINEIKAEELTNSFTEQSNNSDRKEFEMAEKATKAEKTTKKKAEKSTEDYENSNEPQEILETPQEEFPQPSIDFQTENFSEAINIYMDYFVDFDEETLNDLKDMSISEIQDGIRDDFIQMKVDGEISNDVYKALDVMLGNITEETKDILLDPEKREAYFEKIQAELAQRESSEPIKDSEVAEYFRQASEELQVGDIAQERAEGVNGQLQLEDGEMDNSFIVNGMEVTVDPEWLEFFQDAQARGESPEEAYNEFAKQHEIEEMEQEGTIIERRANRKKEQQSQEDKTEITGNADKEAKQDKTEEVELDSDMLGNDTSEISDMTEGNMYETQKKSKRIAVVERNENNEINNVQMFISPLDFARNSGIQFEEISETTAELATLSNQQSKDNEKGNTINGNNESKESDEHDSI